MDKDKPIYSRQNVHNSSNKDENITKNKEDENDVEYEWGKHPNSLKALRKNQYAKGISGNVMGRKPNFESLAKQLKEIGDEPTENWCGENVDDDLTRKEKVLIRIWYDAVRGDLKKIQLLAWLGCLD